MTRAKGLSYVVFLTAVALLRLTLVHAQKPQAQRPAAASQIDLSGKWRFSSFGSFWGVDLKLDPKKSTGDEKVYCGEALREQRFPDTPIIKARLCAEVDPDSGQLLVEVQGVACRAPWRSLGMMDGTCEKGSVEAPMRMDDPVAGAMATPMGGFTAIRTSDAPKK